MKNNQEDKQLNVSIRNIFLEEGLKEVLGCEEEKKRKTK